MIKDNIERINKRISAVCARCNRRFDEITILAASKGRPVAEVKQVIASHIADIGENRVQEALYKYYELPITNCQLPNIKLHMVGHLQTNKAKDAVKIFDLIHSVDSLRLAREINTQASRVNKIQDILLEIKTSPEETKYGLKPEEAIEAVKDISELKNINIRGLMTIAPLLDNAEQARPYFRILRELKDKVNELRVTGCELRVLSMGMSDDFEVAIEEGATMVRLGRAIFEG